MNDFFRNVIRSMRPAQWLKNLFVFAPVLLAHTWNVDMVLRAFVACIAFSFAASSVYILNDLCDRKRDQEHAEKRLRPIASGALSVPRAVILCILLAGISGMLAVASGRAFACVILVYGVLNIAYSLVLKHMIIVDVFAIAANYVLRLVGGTLVIGEQVTAWVIVLGTLLALFLALGKRRSEYRSLADRAAAHRATLGSYTPELLDQFISIVTPSIVMAWILYTLDARVEARLGSPWLPITIPFVLYGLFRYVYLLQVHGKGESPTHTLLSDLPLIVCVAAWGTVIVVLRF